MIDTEAIRQRLDLRALVPATPSRTRYRGYDRDVCPFHLDRDPSFLIYQDGYHCLAFCKESGGRGDVFAFLMLTEGITFPEAARRLSDMAPSESLPTIRERQPRKIDQGLGARLHLAITEDVVEYYDKKLGFALQTVLAFQLGYGVLPGKIQQADSEWIERAHGRFTIPIYEDGALVNIKARRDDRCPTCRSWNTKALKIEIEDERTEIHIDCRACGAETLHPDPEALSKYISLAGGQTNVLFNSDLLRRVAGGEEVIPKGVRTLIMVEGEYKAIALAQAGFTMAISYGQANRFLREWADLIKQVDPDSVLHVVDRDEAGRRSFRLIRDMVRPFTTVIWLPNEPKGDVQEFLRDQGEAPLWEIIATQSKHKINDPAYWLLTEKYRVPRFTLPEYHPDAESAIRDPAA